MLIRTTNDKNPLKFISMERWDCSDCVINQGFIGHTEGGDTYLTWDVKKGIPLFSGSDKIGNNVSKQDFLMFRELFCSNIPEKTITPILSCKYNIMHFKNTFEFETRKVAPAIHVPLFGNRFIGMLLALLSI